MFTRSGHPLALTLPLALALTGCAWLQSEPEVRYTVVAGDTLFEIARAHEVTVDQLRAWNGLEGDLIEVGQVLVIRTGPRAAPPPPRQAPRQKRAPKQPSGGATDLVMPTPRPCLSAPTLGEGAADEAMVASQGLSQAQIRTAMDGFVHHTLRCLEGTGAEPSQALDLSITVGCDGVVRDIAVVSRGDWPAPVATCVDEVLRHTPFPAHDLSDGETFRYPLRFTPGAP